jgi:two-component system, OmpR family, alkaline phosphatase synthesis response regulator PhoP
MMHVATHPAGISPLVVAALRDAGFEPVPVDDVVDFGESEPPAGWDLLIVELGDEPASRLALARRFREGGLAPVLVVAEPHHAVDLAAAVFDDFVLTPVDPSELVLRARRLIGSPFDTPGDEVLHFKDLTLDLATYQAAVAGLPVDLTFMEYELLRFFVSNQGRVWSREQLLERVWGYDYFGGARTVDVHVRRLRAKLGEERASWITTVRSVGYRFG